MNKTAYWKATMGLSAVANEWVNGCPTLLIDSEPAFVVRKNALGRLVVYAHFKSLGMFEHRLRELHGSH